MLPNCFSNGLFLLHRLRSFLSLSTKKVLMFVGLGFESGYWKNMVYYSSSILHEVKSNFAIVNHL